MKTLYVPRRGISLLWVILLLPLFIGLVGLAADTGYGLLIAHQLQNAADSSALAGAIQIKTGEMAVREAASAAGAANHAAGDPVLLALNEDNAPDGDIVLGRYDREAGTFTATLEASNAVKVSARRTADSLNGPLEIIFGGAFGVGTVELSRTAIAMNQGGTGAGLISLCPDCQCGLRITGTPIVMVDGGIVQVDSDHECAVCGSGSGEIIAPGMDVAGGMCSTPGVAWPDDVDLGSPPIGDPLAFLPEPSWDPAGDLGSIEAGGTFSPGYYSGGIDLTGGDVTLLPGIYILDGNGLQIGGNTRFIAEGVMCYIPPGEGYVDISGTGEIHMTPPNPDEYSYPEVGVYEGVTIFQSRSNSNSSRIIGTGLLDLEGTLYFPVAPLEIGGEGEGFGNQLIAWQIWIHGTGDITINYDGSFPAPGNDVFLVE